MAKKNNPFRISTRRGSYRTERRLIVLAVAAMLLFAGYSWLRDNPQHNPMAPLDLRDPVGWATANKLVALKEDVEECRAVLDRSSVAFDALPAAGEGACTRSDRTQLTSFPLAPATPPMTCPVAAALELWRTKNVEPAAREIFGSELARIEHLGVYNCRRIGGGNSGTWSEHATGNAIDIAAFVLADGRRISVLGDWDGTPEEQQFLRRVRDEACSVFATVLSPEYNAAHADHFHFDQDGRWMGVCR